MKNNIRGYTPSSTSAAILCVGLTLMTFVFGYILFSLINAPAEGSAWLYNSGYEMLEYAVMSLTLILCGSIVADIAEKRRNN